MVLKCSLVDFVKKFQENCRLESENKSLSYQIYLIDKVTLSIPLTTSYSEKRK